MMTSALIEAIKKDDLCAVVSLIAENSDVNAQDEKGNHAISIAANYNRFSIAALLIGNGADVNSVLPHWRYSI